MCWGEELLLPILGDAIGGFGGEAATATGLGALEGIGSVEGLGGLGAMGAANELAGTSSAISGGAANPFSLALGNFNSMNPMIGRGLGLLGRAAGNGLLSSGGQQAAPQMMQSPQGSPTRSSQQVFGDRFTPQSLMTNQQPQQGQQAAQLMQIMQGNKPLDPETLLRLRQQGVAI